MRAARVCALAAVRVSFLACVRTRRPVVFDGVVAAVRRADGLRADGLRAAGLRLAAAGFFAVAVVLVFGVVVVLLVSSAMVILSPCPEVRVQMQKLCSP